jgi:Uma2 family endonuclease
MSDNTLQFLWIVTIQGGLDSLYRDDPNVFVAGDLLWYPIEGDNKTRLAPDALVAFGRPKGHRGSYMQWREEGVAPQVAFEVLSPKNRPKEMAKKRAWYFRFGVEEYYEFDPDGNRLRGWIKEDGVVREIDPISGWTSPRLGIRFELGANLTITGPDGREFASFVELSRQRDDSIARSEEDRRRAEESDARAEESNARAEEEHRRAEEERLRAEAEHRRAEEERLRAEEEHRRAEESSVLAQEEHRRAEAEHRRAEESTARAERLATRLRELGLEPDV